MPGTRWEKQRLKSGNAATNNTNVGFHSSPHPDLISFPGGIVGPEECVVDPVGTEATSDNNDTTNREEDDEADALTPRKREREEGWDGQGVDHEIGHHIERTLHNQGRAFGDAIAVISFQLPIA